MPRQSRIEITGCIYHIITRGINRGYIFKDGDDRRSFLKRLEIILANSGGGVCYGWSLMPNHFHLIVRMGKRPISWMMRKLLTGYALSYNRRHRRCGYLFQNRYKSILCQDDVYLTELVRYVHLNPLRAKIVEGLKGLESYEWTGYKTLMGNAAESFQDTEGILRIFGRTIKQSREKLIEYMREGAARGKREDLTGGGLRRSAGGWDEVKKLQANKDYWRGDERILGEGEFVERVLKEAEQALSRKEKNRRSGISIKQIKQFVCERYELKESDLLKKGRANNCAKAKAVLAYYAYSELGIPCKEIAIELNCSQAAVSVLVNKGGELVVTDNIILLN